MHDEITAPADDVVSLGLTDRIRHLKKAPITNGGPGKLYMMYCLRHGPIDVHEFLAGLARVDEEDRPTFHGIEDICLHYGVNHYWMDASGHAGCEDWIGAIHWHRREDGKWRKIGVAPHPDEGEYKMPLYAITKDQVRVLDDVSKYIAETYRGRASLDITPIIRHIKGG